MSTLETNDAMKACDTSSVARETPTVCGRLEPNQALGHGQTIASCNDDIMLCHQTDGNVVAYDLHGAFWSTRTAGRNTTDLVMHSNGNLVLYDINDRPVWQTGTDRYPGAFLAIQDDGNLVIYEDIIVRWASNTSFLTDRPPTISIHSVQFDRRRLLSLAAEIIDLSYEMLDIFSDTIDHLAPNYIAPSYQFIGQTRRRRRP